jgi:hypothetical protein
MKVKIGKYKENRKIKVVIEDHDTWSLDSTLAKVIYPALVAFKKARKKMPGVPMAYLKDEETDKSGNHTNAAVDRGDARFEDDLNKMIWSFREIAEEYPGESQFFMKNGKETKWKRFTKNNKHMGSELVETGLEYDKEGHQVYQNRIDEGVKLFGENYRSLWW